MKNESLETICQRLIAGQIDANSFWNSIWQHAGVSRQEALVDHDRRRRCGFPEVVYAEGKSEACLLEVVQALRERDEPVLCTRVGLEHADRLCATYPDAVFNEICRTVRVPGTGRCHDIAAYVPVVTAGSSDLGVAEEARETLDWMGVRTELIQDIGVAGPWRLLSHLPRLSEAAAVVVVAGMEGALPSVVGGHLACPVVAVPTSVGYGANLGGLSALLGMLNSCAPNVVVVNINAGFKGGYAAGIMAWSRTDDWA